MSLIDRILLLVFPKDKLEIESHHLPTTLNYQRRMARIAPPEVESAVVRGATPMLFVTDKPGRYVGNGFRVTWTIH